MGSIGGGEDALDKGEAKRIACFQYIAYSREKQDLK